MTYGRRPGVVMLLALAWPVAAGAQESGPVAARIVPGVVFQIGVFGDDSPEGRSQVGLSLGAQVCGPRSRSRALVTEATLWTNSLPNPHGGESVRMLHLHAGPQFGSRTYVRATLGIAVQFWTQKRAKGIHRYIDMGLAASLGVGRYLDDKRRLAVEGVGRLTVSPGFATLSLAAQAPVGPCNK